MAPDSPHSSCPVWPVPLMLTLPLIGTLQTESEDRGASNFGPERARI